MANSDSISKKMASLLAQGATMLDSSCPACDTILFRLKSGKIICPRCGAEIKIFKEGDEIPEDLLDYQKTQENLIKLKDEGKMTESEMAEKLAKLRYPDKINSVKKELTKIQSKKAINPQKTIELDTDEYLESDLKHKLMEKMFYFINLLENESQLDNQAKILNNIDKLVDIISKLGGIL
jgi:uncharacterized Zn finger protein (UPF0148 family)